MTSSSEAPVYTFNDDQEISYVTLNNALKRLVTILDEPIKGQEALPNVKLVKEHVEFLLKETLLSKSEVEALLKKSGGDIEKAIINYLESSF